MDNFLIFANLESQVVSGGRDFGVACWIRQSRHGGGGMAGGNAFWRSPGDLLSMVLNREWGNGLWGLLLGII